MIIFPFLHSLTSALLFLHHTLPPSLWRPVLIPSVVLLYQKRLFWDCGVGYLGLG
jgi:hypothetical protein